MKNLVFVFAIMISGLMTSVQAQGTSEFFTKADSFFKTYVKDGRVAYKDIKAKPAELDELLRMAQGISVSENDAANYQAFWINSYNLLVIKGIVDNYPVKSPLDIGGFFDKKKYEIGGTSTTLNDLENKLLRARFPKEPRFHFVLVCAGLGCPPIISQAYLPNTLDDQLQTQTKKALNDPNFIRVNKNKVKISQIFEWYNEDFVQDGQDLVSFINKYKEDKLPEKAKVSYYTYDWTLNDR
ncbi:DUF547 domain-containing protein [Poritiphilus flavus]|uniref:DUF547 domain-containing protein n=1 Tax=Poritiphilus flavus TaxID=2697053 RepID=A0A6L9EDN1_9FLAO|nr:DUF547 domain-containing protein [Poritiphilus flavus]NAS12783.1 DUF547 domain-containing protein [Poritiphilus flavus]